MNSNNTQNNNNDTTSQSNSKPRIKTFIKSNENCKLEIVLSENNHLAFAKLQIGLDQHELTFSEDSLLKENKKWGDFDDTLQIVEYLEDNIEDLTFERTSEHLLVIITRESSLKKNSFNKLILNSEHLMIISSQIAAGNKFPTKYSENPIIAEKSIDFSGFLNTSFETCFQPLSAKILSLDVRC